MVHQATKNYISPAKRSFKCCPAGSVGAKIFPLFPLLYFHQSVNLTCPDAIEDLFTLYFTVHKF